MNQLSKRRLGLVGAVMVVYAFAIPASASALSWSVIGTTHVLHSSNLAFATHSSSATYGAICGSTDFHVDVRSAAQVAVTGASFKDCEGSFAASGCTLTFAPTALPWTVTGLATDDIRIDGLNVDVRYEGVGCNVNWSSQPFVWTGTLGGGGGDQTTWDSLGHQITFSGATGLRAHVGFLLAGPITVFGTFRDPAQTLALLEPPPTGTC
jgi:hypothetical protein